MSQLAQGGASPGDAQPRAAILGDASQSDLGLLVVVTGPGKKPLARRFSRGLEVVLGRDPGCHMVLVGDGVSRRHVALSLGPEGLVVRDTSSNGTLIDGERLFGAERQLGLGTSRLVIGGYQVEAQVVPLLVTPKEVRRRAQAQLLERLDLHKRRVVGGEVKALYREVREALEEIVGAPALEVPKEAQPGLVAELVDEALGLGPLEALLSDAQVSEIMVVDAETIYAERGGRLELTGRRFTDDEAVRSAIERIVTPLGRRIDESSPLVDARLPDGSRVNAVIPPLALRGPCITIRKFPSHRLTAQEMVKGGTFTREMARFLERSVRLKKNILISGGTGSGKTTLLNVLSAAIEPTARVVTIEDAAELCLRQPHVVSLEARPPNLEGKGEYTIRDLLKNALRMRPDRIVVGECRGGEALDMLQAMNTGHEGSMTTTHANSPRQAVLRIETLCLMAGLDLPLSAIRRQIAESVHVIVQQSRLSDGSRKVTSIAEVVGLSRDGHVDIRELFAFEGGAHQTTGFFPSFAEELFACAEQERAAGNHDAAGNSGAAGNHDAASNVGAESVGLSWL